MKQKVLIVGASGLLGSTWVKLIKSRYHVTGVIHLRKQVESNVEYLFIDFNNINHITESLQKSGATIVVNCAGMADVDRCEVIPSQAFNINSLIPERLAQASNELGLKFVQISTDHIFSGECSMSLETDPPSPLNVYARSKLSGENKVLKARPSSLVIRANFFGWGPPYRQSFSDLIINSITSGKRLQLFSDVFFTPLLMQVLVEEVHELIDLDLSGIYHVVGDERLSKFDFGIRIAKFFELDSSLITPGFFRDRKDLTLRPLDMSLSNSKLQAQVIPKSRALDMQFYRLKAEAPNFVRA